MGRPLAKGEKVDDGIVLGVTTRNNAKHVQLRTNYTALQQACKIEIVNP